MKIQIDTYTRILLTIIAALLTVIATGMWCQAPDVTPAANAAERPGIPNMGEQLNQIIAGLQTVNATNQQILETLNGELKVKLVVEPEPTPPAGPVQK